MPNQGQRLGEYILTERIGAGAFGEVWRGHHNSWLERVVAIKVARDPQYVRNLQKEGNAIHLLSHQNIVKAIAFDPYGDPPYLVMEYVPGHNLRAMIERGPMDPGHAVAVMKQTLSALHHAHNRGLIHRDIKPENILIHSVVATRGFTNGTVKLTDFGLGRAATQSLNSIVISRDRHDARQIVGSAQYMAPEQRDGEVVDARADLYSCGVVLFEMLTGKRPAGMEVPSDVNPNVPPYLDNIFRRAYARLERRFSSAGEFFAAFDETDEERVFAYETAEPTYAFQSGPEWEDSTIGWQANATTTSGTSIPQVSKRNKQGSKVPTFVGTAICVAFLLIVVVLIVVMNDGQDGTAVISHARSQAKQPDVDNIFADADPMRVQSPRPSEIGSTPYRTPDHESAANETTDTNANTDETAAPGADTAGLAKRIAAVGTKYLNGENVPRDIPKAIQLLNQAVQLGNSDAAVALGELYAKGEVVEKDDVAAVRYFSKAAKKGNAEGMDALAAAYDHGIGVAADPDAAKAWYEKAAALGDKNATAALAARKAP